MRFISWVPADEDVMRLALPLRRAQRDPPLPGRRSVERPRARSGASPRSPAQEGVEEVVIGLTYSISEVHTHAYYAERAAALADCAGDGPPLPQGSRRAAHVGRRARARPALPVGAAGDRPVELHSHCTIGLAPLVYAGGPAGRVPGAAHRGRRRSRRGTSQPGRRDDAPRPRGRRLHAPARPRGARPPSAEHFRALGAAQGPAARARRASTTPPTTTTSCPAAW